jgi:hypothetical protein
LRVSSSCVLSIAASCTLRTCPCPPRSNATPTTCGCGPRRTPIGTYRAAAFPARLDTPPAEVRRASGPRHCNTTSSTPYAQSYNSKDAVYAEAVRRSPKDATAKHIHECICKMVQEGIVDIKNSITLAAIRQRQRRATNNAAKRQKVCEELDAAVKNCGGLSKVTVDMMYKCLPNMNRGTIRSHLKRRRDAQGMSEETA